jgi:hypothetical protein
MAENKVIIEVEVNGAQQAQDQLNDVAQATSAIDQNAKKAGKQTAQLGETFSAVGEEAQKATGAASKGAGNLQNSLGSANAGAVSLGRAMVTLADNGSRGMIAILGPVGAVIATIYTLYEGYQQLSGAALEYEKIAAVASAVASDLTSKLDELADKGIRLTDAELRNMISSIVGARQGIEYMNEQLAESKKVFADRIMAERELNILLGNEKEMLDRNMWAIEKYAKKALSLVETFMDWRTHQEKVIDASNDLADAIKEEQKYIDDLTQSYKTKYEISIQEQQRQIKYTTTHQEAIDLLKTEIDRVKELNILALEGSDLGDTEKAIAIKKIEIETYEELSTWTSKTRDQIYDEAQARKKNNDETVNGIKLTLEQIKAKKELGELTEAEAKRLEEQAQKQAKATDDEKKRLDAEAKARASAFKARQSQLINEQSQINALRIQLEKQGVDEQLALAVNTYTTQLALNKNNKNQLIIAELQYQQQLNDISQQEIARQQADQAALLQAQNEKIRILQDEAYKEIAIEQEKAKTKKDLQDKIDLLDIQLTMSGNAQQAAMLQKQMDIELSIVEKGSLEAIEIKKRYALEGKKLQDESIAQLKDFADAQAQSFSASVASAIMNGESIQATLKASLKGLATEALARSLYEGAAGLASLALGPVGGVPASQHFAASAAFAGVATVAGLAGAAIPSATTGGAQGGASPTGMAQSPQIQRPEASKQEPLVFNLNFSGATIYDTKESAKRAMSDEIVKYINEPRRGAPRLRVN